METAQVRGGAVRIERFEYLSSPHALTLPDWQGWGDDQPICLLEDSGSDPVLTHAELAAEAAFEQRLEEEKRRAHQAGREQGLEEGRQAERHAQAAALAAAEQNRVRQSSALIAAFDQARERYLQTVEQEVVRLALAIAARILRREAQMDPLLLTGSVRVALGQLSNSTEVRLRVPGEDLELWSDAIALLPNLAVRPVLAAGEGMHLGECVIETSLGSVDLGIRSQLGEIERGFFDRAGASRNQPNALSPMQAPDASGDHNEAS